MVYYTSASVPRIGVNPAALPKGRAAGFNNGGRKMPKILVVDDDNAVRSAVFELLTSWGHEVTEAVNGIDGLAELDDLAEAGTLPDVVLTDRTMPGMGGEEFIRHIRERYPEMLIILMTAYYLDPPEVTAILRMGASRVIGKPFTSDALRRAIHEALWPPEQLPLL